MQIHEFQAKILLRGIGLTSSSFEVIASDEEASKALKSLGKGPFLITPQIHGARVSFKAESEADVKDLVKQLLGQPFGARIAHRLMLSKFVSFVKEEKLVWTLEEKPQNHAYLPELNHFFTSRDLKRMELVLGTTEEGHIYLIDADIHVDKNALYRQKELVECFDSSQMTMKELQAAHYGFLYKEYEGIIGCLASGEGLGKKMVDQVAALGGSASALVALQSDENPYALEGAVKMLAMRSRALLVTLFPEIMNAEVWACWLSRSLKDKKLPVIVRLIGEKKDAARALLAKYPRIDVIDDLEEAARMAIIRAGLL